LDPSIVFDENGNELPGDILFKPKTIQQRIAILKKTEGDCNVE